MTTETLMTEAATTTEGQASEQATQTATGAAEGGQEQQQATDGQSAEGQQADGTKTEGKPKEEEKPQGAPDKYEFKTAEGVAELDPQVLDQYSEVAKELNLPQDAAQKILDKVAPVIQARQAEQLEAARTMWADAAKADKEFGGEKLTENLALAKKAMDTFGSPELRTLLNESGLGNHPELIRLMYRAGKAISEDGFVRAGSGESQPNDPKRLYPNSNMK